MFWIYVGSFVFVLGSFLLPTDPFWGILLLTIGIAVIYQSLHSGRDQ